ncbi:MFS transporter [Streptomyces sp. NPDC058231]|uniref:MFS transporter n=1 Tax=Streptomyces sp. NPDC058231 TaxID=3346392 RepID=UPI0036E5E010
MPDLGITHRSAPALRTNAPSAARAWAVVAMITLLMAINFAEKSVLGLAADPIMKELHLDASEFGLLASSFYLLFSLSAVLVGFLANRVRAKWILGILAVAWSLTALPVFLAGSLAMLFASRITLGAAEGPTAPVAVHAVHKWFPDRRRAMPTAVTQAGAVLGTVIAVPVLSWFILHHGWRSAWLVLAASCLVWAAGWLVVGQEGPLTDEAGPAADAAPDAPRYRPVLLSGSWLGMLVCAFGVYWAVAANLAWVPTYLTKAGGYAPATAGRLAALPSALGTLAMLVLPWLSGRWMRRGATSRCARGIPAGLLAIVSGCCLLAVSAVPAGPLRLVLLCLAFGLPVAGVPLMYLVNAEISPVRLRGATSGLCVGIVTLGGMFAPVVLGRQLDAAATPVAGYQAGFALTAALLVVGGIVAVIAVNPERDARRTGMRT